MHLAKVGDQEGIGSGVWSDLEKAQLSTHWACFQLLTNFIVNFLLVDLEVHALPLSGGMSEGMTTKHTHVDDVYPGKKFDCDCDDILSLDRYGSSLVVSVHGVGFQINLS